MTTEYATSTDGVSWTSHGTVLAGRPGSWDARGARVTCAVVHGDEVVVGYDGRASAAENWEERTGSARGIRGADGLFGQLVPDAGPIGSPYAPGGLRYMSAVAWEGGYRLYYEATRADGAHDLRTEFVSG
jgi:hypothetical protein